MILSAVGGVGYVLLAACKSVGVRYFGVFLAAAGVSIPLIEQPEQFNVNIIQICRYFLVWPTHCHGYLVSKQTVSFKLRSNQHSQTTKETIPVVEAESSF